MDRRRIRTWIRGLIIRRAVPRHVIFTDHNLATAGADLECLVFAVQKVELSGRKRIDGIRIDLNQRWFGTIVFGLRRLRVLGWLGRSSRNVLFFFFFFQHRKQLVPTKYLTSFIVFWKRGIILGSKAAMVRSWIVFRKVGSNFVCSLNIKSRVTSSAPHCATK